MQEPLISILTPFKNTEQFLSECIQSILDQTYKNWELIIVDDHSTDNSYQVVKHFQENDSRIKLYKNPDKGIINALRFAFEQSRGLYISRMDSDDVMFLNKLQVLYDSLRSYGRKHVAIGLVEYFSSEGISDGYSRYEKWLNELTRTGANYSEIYKECVIPSPCWMLHREDLKTCDAFNPDNYPEDYDLTFRMYLNNITCVPCNNVLHKWRDYSTRTSRTHIHYAQNYFLEIKIKYFIKIDYNSKRPLVVWGAGFKGKAIAKYLIKNKIDFYWICDNPNKLGKQIYGQNMHHFDHLIKLKRPQSIITVANVKSQVQIKAYFKSQAMQPMIDYFFFC